MPLQDDVQLSDMELDVRDLLDVPSSGSCSWLLLDEFGDDEGDQAGCEGVGWIGVQSRTW